MKKILFVTTALIATASVAAAEVRISGYGRFGYDYNEANKLVAGRSSSNLTTRLRLQFDMSTETDTGVTFGARLRAQNENRDNFGPSSSVGGTGLAVFNGARFFASYEGFTLQVGNITGALDSMLGLYTTNTRSFGTGVDGMGFNSVVIKGAGFDGYSSGGTGVNGMEIIYSTGGFTGQLSYSQRNGGVVLGSAGGESRTGVALNYRFGDYYVAAAYQSSSNGATAFDAAGALVELNDGVTVLTAGGDFGNFGARLAYGMTEAADSVTLEGTFDIGAASNVTVWINDTSANNVSTVAPGGATVVTDGTAAGINYQYDLGGGATFVAGYVNDAAGFDQAQAGVYFSF